MDDSQSITEMQRTNGHHSERGTDQSAGQAAEPDERLLSFFIGTLTVGGAEKVTVNLVNGLSSRGYNVELVVSQFTGELRSELAAEVSVVELSPSSTYGLGVVAHIPALIRYVRQKNPAALFTQMTHINVVALAAAYGFNTDTIVIPTHHLQLGALVDQSLRTKVSQWLGRRLYPSAEHIIAVSQGVADSIADQTAVDRENISVLYNPIDIELIREQAQEPMDHEWLKQDFDVILFVGRIQEQKDLKTWLRTFRRVHNENSNTRAIIVGKGPLREEMRSFAAELGIGDVVSITGYVENPYAFMRRADLFLLSSRFEGLPTVLIEALACECPIVSTDCPSGPREILAGGKYGGLAPVGDDEELAAAVSEMLAEPIPDEELRTRANEFAPEAVLDEYERFIQQVIPAFDRTKSPLEVK